MTMCSEIWYSVNHEDGPRWVATYYDDQGARWRHVPLDLGLLSPYEAEEDLVAATQAAGVPEDLPVAYPLDDLEWDRESMIGHLRRRLRCAPARPEYADRIQRVLQELGDAPVFSEVQRS